MILFWAQLLSRSSDHEMIRALNFVLHRIPTSMICKFLLLPGIKLMYNNNYTSEKKKINKLNTHSRKTKTGNKKKKVINFASWLARFLFFVPHFLIPMRTFACG